MVINWLKKMNNLNKKLVENGVIFDNISCHCSFKVSLKKLAPNFFSNFVCFDLLFFPNALFFILRKSEMEKTKIEKAFFHIYKTRITVSVCI